jgi:hypothetical protein
MGDSAEVKLVDEIAGEGGAEGDWGYLGSDGMGSGSYPGYPFPRDVLSTPTSASLLLSMDPAALFDFNGTFPPSSSAAATAGSALPAFHDFSCVNPFDDAGHFRRGRRRRRHSSRARKVGSLHRRRARTSTTPG